MNFVDLNFYILLIVTYLLYYFIPVQNIRNLILLISSFVFYGANSMYHLGLFLIVAIVNYILSLLSTKTTYAKLLICANVIFLIYFKYLIFISDTVFNLLNYVTRIESPEFNIVLPIGISFFTFQLISYQVDVYRKSIKPEKNIINYFLYLFFFPQFVAGPVEKAKNLIPQFKKLKTKLDLSYFWDGITLIAIGFFQKRFVSDNLREIYNFWERSYGNDKYYWGSSYDVLICSMIYAYMLYADFSGYTNIARGSAKLFGINLSENFKYPFLRTSVKGLFNNWHMSLLVWIREYIYFPLILNKNKFFKIGASSAVIITFLIMGLWHGAGWTYIFWGLYCGIILVIANKLQKFSWIKNMSPFFGFFIVQIVICFEFLFFRAENFLKVKQYLQALTKFNVTDFNINHLLSTSAFYIAPIIFIDLFYIFNEKTNYKLKVPTLLKIIVICFFFWIGITFRAQEAEFLYFRF